MDREAFLTSTAVVTSYFFRDRNCVNPHVRIVFWSTIVKYYGPTSTWLGVVVCRTWRLPGTPPPPRSYLRSLYHRYTLTIIVQGPWGGIPYYFCLFILLFHMPFKEKFHDSYSVHHLLLSVDMTSNLIIWCLLFYL